MGESPTGLSNFAGPGAEACSPVREATETRIHESLALLDAIDMGELLSALPPDRGDQKRHAVALWLLDIVHERLERVLDDLKRLRRPD